MTNMQEAQKQILNQMEEMVMDSFNRMKKACTNKCMTRNYDEMHLVKNEAVCMDRCVSKYLELHDIIGKNVSKDKETYDLLAEPPYRKKTEA